MLPNFKTLYDLQAAFPDEQSCVDHVRSIRWKDGEFCPHCGGTRIYHFSDKQNFKCGDCRQRFSIKVGTIFHDTKLPLRKWFMAIWMITNHPKGIASTTLAKDLGVTQKTAWFVLHRIRHAARTKSFQAPLKGIVEVDETFVGGKARNKHVGQRGKSGMTGGSGKAVVAGVVERDGEAVAKVVENVRAETLTQFIRETVSPDAEMVVTDQWVGYKHLGKEYRHAVVNHAQGEYVNGNAHTQTVESMWALLKRQIIGIHHWVSAKHLGKYAQEMTWRFNRRDMKSAPRMNELFGSIEGPLPYKTLIAA
jgi:transposase-like protein